MPFLKNCLLVAPDTDLYYSSKEIESVVNLLHANLLNGTVHVNDLIDRVRLVQPNLLIISSHGTNEGIALSDGIVGADLLKPILSTAPLECVFLNTCEGYETASRIHNEIPVAFISSIAEVPDREAYVTMSTFAYHLSVGETYRVSWFKSRAASDGDLIFLPNMNYSAKEDESGMFSNKKKEDETTVNRKTDNGDSSDIYEKVRRLEALIYGSERWNSTGILPTLTKLERGFNQIRILLILLLVLISLIITAVIARGWPI